jgi:peptidoglycan/xylan/chitin deacetylase (PgdA/CDA1 family)
MTFPRRILHAADHVLAQLALASGREGPALVAFMCHHLFENWREVERGHVDPFQPVLVEDLRRFVTYFLENGYRFVSPSQILRGLDSEGRFALLTFDDGYASSLRAVPVLKELGVPATFFVTVSSVVRGEAFWWDVVYREMKLRGRSGVDIRRRQVHLKTLHYREVGELLVRELGPQVLRPAGDDDRPLTTRELRKLGDEDLVTIGNHTTDHALLPLYEDAEIRAQIGGAQDELARLTGIAPEIIAYPNGAYDRRVGRIARALGLRLGMTVQARKNRPVPTDDTAMALGRFPIPAGADLLSECLVLRSDIQLRSGLHRLADAMTATGRRVLERPGRIEALK